MKKRSSDEVKKVNWDAIDLPSPSPTRGEIRSGEIDNHRQPSTAIAEGRSSTNDIDHDSAVSITAQTLAARIPDMSDIDIEWLERRLRLEVYYRIDPSLVPSYRSELDPNQSELGSTGSELDPNQSELGSTGSGLDPNQSELGSNGFRVPYGYVEYCRVPKNGRDYYYYYWRYYTYADGDEGRERVKKSIYLGSDRHRAQNKIYRLTS